MSRHGRACGAFLVTVISLAALPIAHAREWVSIGPDGGRVFALVADPTDGRTLYAGLRAALVYRSDDAGETWTPTRRGLPGGDVHTLTVDPDAPFTLYAGLLARFGGAPIHKSTDRGEHWQPASAGILGNSARVTLTPGGVLLATASGNVDQQAPGIFRSLDGGETWTPVFEGIVDFEDFIIEEFGTITVDPTSPDTLFVCTNQPGIVRSTDGGETWARLESVFGAGQSCDESGAGPFPAGRLYAWVKNRLWTSDDGGLGWTLASGALPPGPAGAPIPPSGFLADPETPGRLYAGLFSDGAYVSPDDGASWTPLTAALDGPNAFVVVPGNPRRLYFGTDDGLHVSVDEGATAQPSQAGLSGSRADDVVVHPDVPRRMVAAGDGRLWRSTNGGRDWTRTGPDDISVQTLLVDPVDPQRFYAGVFLLGVYRSSDAGITWERAPGLPAGTVTDLAAESLAPRALYALISVGLTTPAVYRSTDGGTTWTPLPAPPVSGLRAIAVSPTEPGTLYLVASASQGGGIAEWTAASGEWSELAEELGIRGLSIAADPAHTGRLWVGGADEVWRSDDGGETWESRSTGLPGRPVPALAVDPLTDGHVFADTPAGVFETTDDGASWHEAGTGLVPPGFESIMGALTLLPGRFGALFAGTQGGGVARLDACTRAPLAATRVTLHGLGSERAVDQLLLRGTIVLDARTDVDPARDGLALRLDVAGRVLLDVTTDAGHWRAARSGRAWRFVGTGGGDGPDIRRATLRRPVDRPGELDYRMRVAGGTLAVDASELPLGVYLGPFGAEVEAQCGGTELAPEACRRTPGGSRLRCG
jgi:photosystem II stability/assembly factor-like uncharacterized protein